MATTQACEAADYDDYDDDDNSNNDNDNDDLHKHVKRFDQETVYPLPDLHNNRLYVNFFPVGATFKKSWKHTHPVGNKWI